MNAFVVVTLRLSLPLVRGASGTLRDMPKSAGSFSWGNTTVDTACPLDCPDSCSLTVTVENGKIREIDG